MYECDLTCDLDPNDFGFVCDLRSSPLVTQSASRWCNIHLEHFNPCISSRWRYHSAAHNILRINVSFIVIEFICSTLHDVHNFSRTCKLSPFSKPELVYLTCIEHHLAPIIRRMVRNLPDLTIKINSFYAFNNSTHLFIKPVAHNSIYTQHI